MKIVTESVIKSVTMFRKGKHKHSEFYKNLQFSKSLNDLYGNNILNVKEPEKDQNYWNLFGVSTIEHALAVS